MEICMKRSFYFQDDRSNKFWTIERLDCKLVSANGRVGATARETHKAFANEADAQREFERQIVAKFKAGYMEGIAPPYSKPDWSAMSMSDEAFWRIIALFNWKKTGDDDAVIEPAVNALAQMAPEHIKGFEDILAAKLYALDTVAHAREIGDEAYQPGKYFSSDWFLYERCCVVANGAAFYEAVLAEPRNMPKDVEFEAILYVAGTAYERKTGEEIDHASSVSYETFANKQGWQNATDA
jgi:predicted DNA-binding WGR domain protein